MRTLLRDICPAFVATRLALFAVATLAVLRLPVNGVEALGFHLPPQPYSFLEAWARYDACWYVAIAERGYRSPIGPWGDMRPAFLPLFPSLVAAATLVAHIPMLAALMVSNLCFFLFIALLWKLIEHDWDAAAARRAMWIYLLFPSAFFLSGAYSESLLMAVSAGALLAARRDRWWLAGLLASAATLARPVGVLAVAPLVVEYLQPQPSVDG